MLRRSARFSCGAAAKSPFAWSTQLVSFDKAPSYRRCTSVEELGAAHPDPSAVPAFVIPDVITREEERAILRYQRLLFDRLDYCDDHYDSLISHYKEFYRSAADLVEEPVPELHDDAAGMTAVERTEVEGMLRGVLERAAGIAHAHSPNVPVADRVHFLQLDPRGTIKAHADNENNSSGFVAGLSFGSARVMTLTMPTEAEAKALVLDPSIKQREYVELLLLPRSLYVLAGSARYSWFHSVDESANYTNYPAAEPGKPIWYRGAPLPEHLRATRSVMIWRGVSPAELFRARLAAQQ